MHILWISQQLLIHCSADGRQTSYSSAPQEGALHLRFKKNQMPQKSYEKPKRFAKQHPVLEDKHSPSAALTVKIAYNEICTVLVYSPDSTCKKRKGKNTGTDFTIKMAKLKRTDQNWSECKNRWTPVWEKYAQRLKMHMQEQSWSATKCCGNSSQIHVRWRKAGKKSWITSLQSITHIDTEPHAYVLTHVSILLQTYTYKQWKVFMHETKCVDTLIVLVESRSTWESKLKAASLDFSSHRSAMSDFNRTINQSQHRC